MQLEKNKKTNAFSYLIQTARNKKCASSGLSSLNSDAPRKRAFLRTRWGEMPISVRGFIKLTLPALSPGEGEADAAKRSRTTGIFVAAQNAGHSPSFIYRGQSCRDAADTRLAARNSLAHEPNLLYNLDLKKKNILITKRRDAVLR